MIGAVIMVLNGSPGVGKLTIGLELDITAMSPFEAAQTIADWVDRG